MSLPVMLTPFEQESLPGFLMRVSQRNVVPNSIQLLRSFGLRLRLTYLPKQMQMMADECGIMATELERINPQPNSASPLLRVKFQRKHCAPICPVCLADQAYLRQAWSHDFIVACPHHNCELVEACPACQEPLSIKRQRIEACDCGQSLTHLTVSVATHTQLAIAALLQDVPHMARQELPEIFHKDPAPADIAEFLGFLGAHLANGETSEGKPRKAPRPRSLAESSQLINRIWQVVSDWPHGLTAAIDQRLQQTEGPGLAKRLGGWYRMLHKEFAGPAYDFAREVLAQHASTHFDGHLNLRLSTIDPKHLQDKCWLTPAEAGRLIGIGSQLLAMAVITGEVPGKVSAAGANRYVSLHRNVVEKIRRSRQAHLTATDVRKRLGVSKVLFERLMQAGALVTRTKKQRPALVSAEFLAADVDTLIARLCATVQPREVPADMQVGLHDISARHGISTDRICGALQKVLHGDILPIRHMTEMPGLAGLRYDLRDIRATLVEELHEPVLLISDLVRMQGWKHEAILAWVKAGLLSTVQEQRGRQLVTVIPVSALLAFMSRYLVLADAAERVGSKSNWILRGLMPAGVSAVGAATLPGGGQRGVLLEIDAVLQAAQWNKRPAQPAPVELG